MKTTSGPFTITETLYEGRGTVLLRGFRTHDRLPVVLKVLDWKHGYFELAGGAPAAANDSAASDTSITHLLLEHARLRDEAGTS